MEKEKKNNVNRLKSNKSTSVNFSLPINHANIALKVIKMLIEFQIPMQCDQTFRAQAAIKRDFNRIPIDPNIFVKYA